MKILEYLIGLFLFIALLGLSIYSILFLLGLMLTYLGLKGTCWALILGAIIFFYSILYTIRQDIKEN